MESVRAARRNAPGASSSLEGSLTANYSHHQKEWALQIRALQNRQVRFATLPIDGTDVFTKRTSRVCYYLSTLTPGTFSGACSILFVRFRWFVFLLHAPQFATRLSSYRLLAIRLIQIDASRRRQFDRLIETTRTLVAPPV